MLFSSCIGSFSLTNKLLAWNKTVGNKFVNELVFFAFWVLPVYEVSALADVLVLNSIEFWSGGNPVAKGTKVIEGQEGRYLVECDSIFTFVDDTHVSLPRPDGSYKTVELSDAGLYAYQQAVSGSCFAMR